MPYSIANFKDEYCDLVMRLVISHIGKNLVFLIDYPPVKDYDCRNSIFCPNIGVDMDTGFPHMNFFNIFVYVK